MGSITERKSKRGGPSTWCAQIRISKDRQVVLSISQTFEREAAARTWLTKKERELAKPGGLERAIEAASMGAAGRPTLRVAIERSITESNKEIRKTKAQVLRSICEDKIADMICEDILSQHIVEYALRLLEGRAGGDGNVQGDASSRRRAPSTVGNYMSHLSSVFAIAKPAWNYPLEWRLWRMRLKSASGSAIRRSQTSGTADLPWTNSTCCWPTFLTDGSAAQARFPCTAWLLSRFSQCGAKRRFAGLPGRISVSTGQWSER